MRATDLPALRSESTPRRARLSDPTPAHEGWGDVEVDTLLPAPRRVAGPPRARRRFWSGRVQMRQVRLPSAWRRQLADARWALATWWDGPQRRLAPATQRAQQQPLVMFM